VDNRIHVKSVAKPFVMLLPILCIGPEGLYFRVVHLSVRACVRSCTLLGGEILNRLAGDF